MAIIDGRKIADELIAVLTARPAPSRALAVVMVGGNDASRAFVARKQAVAERLGISFRLHDITENASQDVIEKLLRELSVDAGVGGIVLQLPVPKDFNRDALIAVIDIKKDVDNLTGKALVESPTVGCVKEIFAREKCAIRDFKNIVLVGQGFLVGQPIAVWLRSESIPYSVVDIDTMNSEMIIRTADLVISGVGKTGVVRVEWLKDGTGFIDFGYPADINQQELMSAGARLRLYTPTPHGTGPILVAKLFENFYRCK